MKKNNEEKKKRLNETELNYIILIFQETTHTSFLLLFRLIYNYIRVYNPSIIKSNTFNPSKGLNCDESFPSTFQLLESNKY